MSWTVEIECSASADRMFRAAILDWHNLGAKISPEVLETGSEEENLRQLIFTSVVPFAYMKEFVDRRAFECESNSMEGYLGTRLESASTKYQILDATAGNGCIVKVETTTKPLPGIDLNDESTTVIEKAKEGTVKHFKIVEAFLLANPDKYNSPPVEELNPASEGGAAVDVLASDGGDVHPCKTETLEGGAAVDLLASGGGDVDPCKTETPENFSDNYQTVEARYVRGWGYMMRPHTDSKPAKS